MIEFKQLNKTYQLNNRVFNALIDINLRIESGEIFGIVGESGAGKSTLLRMVNLLEQPTSGHVLIDGENITNKNATELKNVRRHIGMVFQHFNLLSSRTAFENIALPLELMGQSKEVITKEVNRLLDIVHLQHHAHHYPDQLSGGQKQRVAIARALATKPSILLCDEPTSALDHRATHAILNLLKEIKQQFGVTIVIITHELNVIKQICDRAALLSQGKLIEYGAIIDLFARPKEEQTKQLIQKAMHIELPDIIKKQLQHEADVNKSRLVRFTFVGDDSKQPFITTLVKKFGITISIIQANIENIQNETIGFTVCQLSGDHAAINEALQSIKSSSVMAEVLGYV